MITDKLHKIFEMVRNASDACIDVYYSSDFDIKLKSDNSPVTAADLAVHRIIEKGLKELTPDIPLISEEVKTPYSVRGKYEKYWLLDPIDGTKEFIKRSGEFTINLGLIDKGEPVFGVVHIPVQQKLYFGGSLAKGAFRLRSIDKTSQGTFVVSTPLSASPITDKTEKLAVACSRDHSSPQDDKFALNLTRDFYVKRLSLGSTLKPIKLAEGEVHFCPRAYAPYDWDLAAVHAIVKGAGGDVLTFDGQPLEYNSETQRLPSFMAVSDPSFEWRAYL
jgi:3'(2'), 5'-bisphosphate nucleotidase